MHVISVDKKKYYRISKNGEILKKLYKLHLNA
jgi:hypothetical protein